MTDVAQSRFVLGFGDTLAMAGRNVRRLRRAPDQVVFTLVSPIMFTLLFRYVFGGAIRGLGPINYVDYLIPGIAVQTAIFTSGNSGFALAEDRSRGFVDRLRSLPMARVAVLAGRVLADSLSNVVGLVIIVIVGLAVGFRPHSVPGLVLGFLILLAFSAPAASVHLASRCR
jgi:ABC transporter DrrB family efflux protein